MVDQLAYEIPAAEGRNAIFGIVFSQLRRGQLVHKLLAEPVPSGHGVRLVVTANLDHISNLSRNARFRAAYAGAWTATADGWPVYLYTKLRGGAVPERVTGADLSAALLHRMVPGRCRPFFVVGNEEAGRRLKDCLIRRGFDAGEIGWLCPAHGFENDAAASVALADAVRAHATSHLFFGLGAPKSEIWIHEHRHLLGDTYALSIGASLDFHVGIRRRAPRWMQNCGLEWLWRVGSEPRRLLYRYGIESWIAVWAMVKDLVCGSRSAGNGEGAV